MRCSWLLRKTMGFVALLCCTGAPNSLADEVYVPDELKPWVDWVMHGQEQFDCPYDAQGGGRVGCVWIREIEVNVRRNAPTGASFRINAYAFVDSKLTLPTSNAHKPHDVLLNAEPAILGGGNQTPRVGLPAGPHEITGELTWGLEDEPEFLHVPRAALLSLAVDTEGPVRPFLDNNHLRLWLTRTMELAGEANEYLADTLSVKVFRHLEDGLPQRLTTYIELAAGGRPRVVELGKVLSDQFSLIALRSGIPANISDDGILSVLVSRGENTVVIASRANGLIDSFSYERASKEWPDEEIWGFQPNRNLRVVSVEGPPRVNLEQVQAPGPLSRSGSDIYGYVLSSDSALTLIEEQRGNVNPNPARFNIQRNLWLSFDGDSYVVADSIQAQTDSEIRIAASYLPGKVEVDGQLRLISFDDPTAKDNPGINLNQRNANIQAVSVIDGRGPLRANGWHVDANSLSATLHLPPGWRLLWTTGVDKVEQTWLSKWSIWDVFLCLLLVSFVFRIGGVWWAATIFVTVVLTYQESPLPTIGWLVLAGLIYLTNLVNANWFRSATSVVYWTLAVAVAIVTVYFAALSAREAVFPQLDAPSYYPTVQPMLLSREDSRQTEGLRFQPSVDPDTQLTKQLSVVTTTGTRLPSTSDSATTRTALSSVGSGLDSRLSSGSGATDFDTTTHGVTIQTGPGTPSWRWRSAQLSWSGPVAKDQTVSLALMPPWATRIVAGVGAVLALLAIGFFIAMRSTTVAGNLPGFLRGVLPVLAIALLVPTDILADTPDSRILQELRSRLTEPPDCLPDCAYVEDVRIEVDEESLGMNLLIHAEQTIAVALPKGMNSWNPNTVLANGKESPLQRDAEGSLYVLLGPGKHTVDISANIGDLNRFEIDFPLKPSLIDIGTTAWVVEGLTEGKLKGSHLSFAKLSEDSTEETRLEPALLSASQPIQPYIQVIRRMSLAYEPTVFTTVVRIAPDNEPFTVQVPLLANETVLQATGTVQENVITLSFREDENSQSWSSQFRVDGPIELTAPDLRERNETWSIRGSDFWAFKYEGITPVKSDFNETVFHPRSNETLTLNLSRPVPAPGNVFTIESANLGYVVGNRSHRTSLQLLIHASQSANFAVTLPDDAVVQGIAVRGEPQPIPADPRIVLPLRTGTHRYNIDWLVESGTGLMFSTPQVELESEARNINMTMSYPEDRWTLYLGGPTLGGAVMFWAVIAVVLLVAIAISRLPNMPVTTTDAILLSLGATLTNLWALLFAGAWFLAIWVRSRKREIDRIKFFYYLKQIAYITLSVTGFSMLVSAVPTALLGQPNMHIAGYGSGPFTFRWFSDASDTLLPTAWVLSLPRWVFFIAMLIWSLWLAFALLKWTKSAWVAATQPEFWPAFRFWKERRARLSELRKRRKAEQEEAKE